MSVNLNNRLRFLLKKAAMLLISLAVVLYGVPGFFPAAPVFASSNLLTNPGGETGDFSGWTVANGGSGWNLTFNGTYRTGTHSFMSSYSWGTLSQEIDLVGKGYTTTYLDSQPTVDISNYVIGYFNVADPYQVKVLLKNASHATIATFDTGTQTATGSWTQITHAFSSYGSGLRYIYFEMGGRDVENWGSQYGAVFDDASVTISDPPPVTYTLTYIAGDHGSISGSTSQTVNSGSNGTPVTAVPAEGYRFVNWTGSYTSTSNPLTDTNVTGNKSLTASFAISGYAVTNPPASITVSLSSDWNTNVASTLQTGTKTVGIAKAAYRIATFDVDFSANRDWSNLTTDSNGTKAVFHYDGGFTALPGHSGTDFTLYIPDKGGTKVRICPNAASIAQVTTGCNGEYFLTASDSNVTKLSEDGIAYWKVSGLSGTGGEDGGTGSSGTTSFSAPLFTDITLFLTLGLTALGGIKISTKLNPHISSR